MAVTRSDAIATTIVVVFTIFLLQVCQTLVQKGIDLKYEWASDGSSYHLMLIIAQFGIGAVVPIIWVSYLKSRPKALERAQKSS